MNGRPREPDFSQFLKVLKREGKPDHLPIYEHVASGGFISRRIGKDIGKASGKDYWKLYAGFWLGLGFDCVPLEVPFDLGPAPSSARTDALSAESEAGARIFSVEDFDKFKWPSLEEPIDFRPFEWVAEFLPSGAKIVGGVCAGPFEVATQQLLGLSGLCYALQDMPRVVEGIFGKLNSLYVSANRQLASMDCVGACRQGDDLGFKTSTFMPPDFLRRHVFPVYRGMADAAHAEGKPFLLHSCGNLKDVYGDIIACGVDAKHSFEDQIMPVTEFKRLYGKRITPLGGLDVDILCRSSERGIRDYTRRITEECFADGHWAMGTGNSLPDYMPVENYLIALDEARRVT